MPQHAKGKQVISSNLRTALKEWDEDQKEQAQIRIEEELEAERERKEAERRKKQVEDAEQGRPAEDTEAALNDERARRDEYHKAVLALGKLISYIVFLAFIFVVVFVTEDNDAQYRTISGMEATLRGTELESNVYFDNVMSASQMFSYLQKVFCPFAAAVLYYNGESLPENGGDSMNYQGTWANGNSMALGRARIRQVRVQADVCHVPRQFDELDSGGVYQGIRKCYPGWYPIYEKKTEYRLNGTNEVWQWLEHSDGDQWQSHSTKLQYPPSGFWEDLPTRQGEMRRKLDDLESLGFIDSYTRAVFVDLSFYNAQVDQIVTVRHVFEQLPTGTIVPSLDVDAVPLLSDLRVVNNDGTMPRRVVAFIMEIVLYICIFLYLRRASDDILVAGGFFNYLKSGWNLLEIANVSCFLVVVAMRCGWMLRAGQISYEVYTNERKKDPLGYIYYEQNFPDDKEYDEYTRIRVPASLWRYGRTMLALGILINFMKAFKFLQASRHLSQFSRTVAAAIGPAVIMLVIVCIINCGYAIAFHLTFGVLAPYKDFTEAFYTLSLFYLGEFDMESLVDTAPYLGVFFFVSFSILSIIILMTMFLKLIDVAYAEILDELRDGDVEEFGELVLAALRHLSNEARITLLIRNILSMKRGQFDVSNDEIRQHLDRWVPGKHDKKKKEFLAQLELAKQDKIQDLERGGGHDGELDSDEGSLGEDEGLGGASAGSTAANEEKKKKRTPVEKEVDKILKERKKQRGQYPSDPVDEAEYNSVRKQVVRRFVRGNELKKITEQDLDAEEVLERVKLMNTHATLLQKMASRVLNNVETFTAEPNAGADIPMGSEPEKPKETPEVRAMRTAIDQSQQVLETKISTKVSAAATTTERVEEALEAIDALPQPSLPNPTADIGGVDAAIVERDAAAAAAAAAATAGADAHTSLASAAPRQEQASIAAGASPVAADRHSPESAPEQGRDGKPATTGPTKGGTSVPPSEHPVVARNRDLSTRGYTSMEAFPGLVVTDPHAKGGEAGGSQEEKGEDAGGAGKKSSVISGKV